MKSKFNEKIIVTADLEIMRDLFLAERLLRSWEEDFVDEDTSEVVTVERNEIILEKGEKLDHDNLTKVNFHLQAGDIKEVRISDQQRFGTISKRSPMVWQVSVKAYSNKRYNLFLYANSLEIAKEIATDYMEQLVHSTFSIIVIKELDYSTLIPDKFGEEQVEEQVKEKVDNLDPDAVHYEEEEEDYYKIEVKIDQTEDGDCFDRNELFIVKTKDAEKGKEKIINYLLLELAKEKKEIELVVTIISAKTIPCNYVVDYEFSLEYLKDSNEDEAKDM